MIQSTRIPIIKRPQGYFLRWYYNGWHYWQFFTGALNYLTEGEKYRTRGTRSITASSGQLTESQAEAVRTILNTTEVYLYSDAGWMAVKVDTGEAGIKNNDTKGCEVVISLSIGSRMLSITGFSPVIDVPVIPPSVDQCEIVIGTQIWMCKNYDSNYPGSKVYNDDEANRALYGGLYTFDMVNNPGFCPDGWRVPSESDWEELIDFVGGENVAGGILKQTGTDYWNTPNEGAIDSYGFKALGAGYVDPFGVHSNLKNIGYFWTTDMGLSIYGKAVLMTNNSASALIDMIPPSVFASVRLIKSALAPVKFGYLYNWYVVSDSRNIANVGWHVPAPWVEYTNLDTYLFSQGTGKVLKESGLLYWLTDVGTNDYNFNGRGSGYRSQTDGTFAGIRTSASLLTTHNGAGDTAMVCFISNGSNSVTTNASDYKKKGNSIRLVKDSTALTEGQTGTYTGNDGKVYRTICIGSQEWLADNLCETKYRNGDTIPEVTDNAAWAALTTGARCSYNNDESNAIGGVKIIDDWFLPSKDELNAIYTELHLNGIGGLSAAAAGYWCSTDYFVAGSAYYQEFNAGLFTTGFKSDLRRVRACRSFAGEVGSYNLRDIGPAGGYIFAYSDGRYYEAAPFDQSTSCAWSNVSLLLNNGTAIGTGQANTAAIIAQAGHTASAAKVCDDLIIYK